MPLSLKDIEAWRRKRYRLSATRKIRTDEAALQFINECGFLLLFRIRGLELPSLWEAHAHPWPEAWNLKQTLPERRLCTYAKVLHGKGTFISWEFWPKFFGAYADRQFYEWAFRDGKMSRTEKTILDLLRAEGPLRTDLLRRRLGLPGKAGTREFHRALDRLQQSFRVTAAGGDTIGWSHFNWDLVGNIVPDLVLDAAFKTERRDAVHAILRKYLDLVGAATLRQILRLFRWERDEVQEALHSLVEEGAVVAGMRVEGQEEEVFACSDLADLDARRRK